MEPPPFQESARCDVCHCSFSTFRRRHHCRCCGRTLCADHSSNQMALPKFGLYSPVRVCTDCFNDSSRLSKGDPSAVSDGTSGVTDSISRLDINNSDTENKTEEPIKSTSTRVILECKCGMPLCICEAPATPKDSVDSLVARGATVAVRSNPKPKKTEKATQNRGSTSNSKHGTVFNSGQATCDKLDKDYESSGEGLREAIKNGDSAAVKKLLDQGVNANFCDKQGLSLLHLAAVFNKTEITFTLLDHGANPYFKNSQGETPLDCAPATLQYKMKTKIEESQNQM